MREQVARLVHQFASRFSTHRNSCTQIIQKRLFSGRDGYAPFAYPPTTHIPTPEETSAIRQKNALTAVALIAAAGIGYYTAMNRGSSLSHNASNGLPPNPPTVQHLVNWSGTHECNVQSFYQPESIPELESIVKKAHENGQKLRCVGSGLSPNAIAFESRGMVSLGLLDKVLKVDTKNKTVTVQAGARVQDVADYLRPRGLTLQNYASIREQTIGGFTQVSAHGTGSTIPPVDDAVVAFKLITPAQGTLELSKETNRSLFDMARVGLGCLGIVAEMTLQCVDAHKLVESTFVATPSEIEKNHEKWLKENKHLRYMWIPSTDAVVVVQCNEESSTAAKHAATLRYAAYSQDERMDPLRSLLRGAMKKKKSTVTSEEELLSLSATQCRDALLAVDPLNSTWVKRVNTAEAEHWRRSQGLRAGWNDEILGFDCGGQQWVLEVAFPCGSTDRPSWDDIGFMKELLKEIEKKNIPAPAPIEQRWTCGSSSLMSPAHGTPVDLFSWVGIIMYLPENDDSERANITRVFKEYGKVMQGIVGAKYGAVEHWAKIEVPQNDARELKRMRQRLKKKYPLDEFEKTRNLVDPKNIFGNELIDTLLKS